MYLWVAGNNRIILTFSHNSQRLHTLPVYEQLEGMVLLPPRRGPNELVVMTAGSTGQVRLWKAGLVAEGKPPALELMAEQPKSQYFGEARDGYMHLRYNPFGRPTGTTPEDESS
jgi:hypothetical protein